MSVDSLFSKQKVILK